MLNSTCSSRMWNSIYSSFKLVWSSDGLPSKMQWYAISKVLFYVFAKRISAWLPWECHSTWSQSVILNNYKESTILHSFDVPVIMIIFKVQFYKIFMWNYRRFKMQCYLILVKSKFHHSPWFCSKCSSTKSMLFKVQFVIIMIIKDQCYVIFNCKSTWS